MNSPPRLPPLSESEMTEDQRRVYRAIVAGPRGGVRGPFDALLRSPELAEKAGLAPQIAEDIAEGRRPAAMQADEAAIFEFCSELHETKHVSDAAWTAALERFGERGVIDLIGTCGYYTLVSMVLNATRHPLPEGVAPPLRPLS